VGIKSSSGKSAPAIVHVEPEFWVSPLTRYGTPVPPKRKSGERGPTHVPTDELRHLILVMRANGIGIDALSDALNLTGGTLQRYYGAELKNGFERVKSHVGAAVVNAALMGNISAAKYWLSVHCPEWRVKGDLLGDQPDRDDEVVHFYLPPNRRDEPEDLGPITIDGEAEAA
jgi:hypothetical protein